MKLALGVAGPILNAIRQLVWVSAIVRLMVSRSVLIPMTKRLVGTIITTVLLLRNVRSDSVVVVTVGVAPWFAGLSRKRL